MNVTPVKAMVFPETLLESDVKQCDFHFKHHHVDDYSVGYQYFNGLSVDVFLVNRLGNVVRLARSNASNTNGKLMCANKHAINRTSAITSNRNMGVLNSRVSNAYKMQNDAVDGLDNNTNLLRRFNDKFCLLYQWTEEELSRENGCYVAELDIVITLNEQRAYDILHPQAETGKRASKATAYGQDYHRQLAWTCYIVDKDNTIGPRYTTIAGETFKIPVAAHSDEPDGVYIVHSKPCQATHNRTSEMKRLSFEEADKLGITHLTQESARASPQKDTQLTHDKLDLQLKRLNLASKLQDLHLREKTDRAKKIADETAAQKERFERERSYNFQQQQLGQQKSSALRKDMMDLGKLLLLTVSTLAAVMPKKKSS
jgi:hypothetical protein